MVMVRLLLVFCVSVCVNVEEVNHRDYCLSISHRARARKCKMLNLMGLGGGDKFPFLRRNYMKSSQIWIG
jgi:hypothetical protein